tara:strand:- start:11101 stop:11391 length:291 start_codon:yes stop_codon:yes gene_type:complete
MNFIGFLSGIYMISFAASGLIFLNFFKSTGDRFFKYFCYACWMLSIERFALFLIANPLPAQPNVVSETETWVYLFRLFAFLIILYAIVDKNRKSKS